jgi:hypothetical protein
MYGGYGSYAPYYNGGYGGYCYPMGGGATVLSPSLNGYPYSNVPGMPPAGSPAAQQTGPYPYDGGPANPVPMPTVEQPAPAQPAPTLGPRRVAPQAGQGLHVSIPDSPRPSTGFAYPAYGEDNRATSFATDRTRKAAGR